MKRVISLIHYLLLIFLFVAFISPLKSQTKDKLHKLNETITQMNLSGRDLTEAELLLAIQKNEELLTKYSSNEFLPTVLFQLSELYIRKAKLDYENAWETYEIEYKKFENKKIASEPMMPRVSFSKAINYLYDLLDNHSNTGLVDKVLYRLALCHQEEENVDRSIQYFKRLIAATPRSNFVPESYFRLGEHYFNKANYEEAINYYQKIVTSDEMWSSDFYDMSHYKLGWSFYNLNRYPEAISHFVTLLNDIDVLQRVKTQKLDITAADLKREAITYVSVCFSEYSDPDLAFKTLSKLTQNEIYRNDIISQLGGIYLKQDRLDEAIQTYQFLLREIPLDANAPYYASQIVDAYLKRWDLIGANEARGQIVNNFNRDSNWYACQSDSIIQMKALEIVKDALYKKGVYHQNQAQESNSDITEYRNAIEQYRHFLEFYSEDSSAYKINFYLADCYYALKQYEVAAEEYKKVFSIYSENDYGKEAAYNSVLSYYNASKLYKTTNPQKFSLQGFYGLEGKVTIEVGNPATQQFILASNDMLKLMPQHPQIVDVLMKEAELLNEINRFDLARRVYFKVVQDYPHSSQFTRAAALIAQSYFQEEDYDQAEKWYSTVVTMLPDTMDIVKRSKIRMASSQYKKAQKLKETDNLSSAAVAFEQAALKYPQSQIADLALAEAGNLYKTMGDTAKAATVFEEFITNYPDSKMLEMCAITSATYREELGQWDKAAENYLLLRYSNSTRRIPAIFKAGISLYNAAKWKEAIEILDEYAQIANDPNPQLEAFCKVGLSYYELDDFEKAGEYFRKSISFYNSKKNQAKMNSYFAAQSQYMLGEIDYVHFASINLTTTNFKKKAEALAKASNGFKKTIDFKVAEWTTASMYKMGKLFEEMANAMINAPLPDGLSDEEVVEYTFAMKKQYTPLQKNALDMYKRNIELAKKNRISNPWITLSKSRSSMLSSLLRVEK